MTDKFSLLASIASDWWWEMDADLRITFLSERFTDVFGLPADYSIGKRRNEIARSDYDSPTWKAHFDDLAYRRPFRDFETTVIDAKGVSRPVALSGTPTFAPDGTFTGYVGVGRDLTEIRNREHEAVAHARNLEAIMQNIDQGVMLLDADLKVVAYNPRLVAFLELDPLHDHRGRSYDSIVKELAARGEYDLETVSIVDQPPHAGARTLSPFTMERRRTDGRIFSASFAPLASGGSVMTYTDVTEARTREKHLKDSEERFRQLFEQSPLPKWVFSLDTLRFIEVNEAAIATYGYSRDEFLAMSVADVQPLEDVEKFQAAIQRSAEHWQHVTGFCHRYKNGRIVDVEIFLRDIVLDGVPARLSVILDVTARKEAERHVQRIFETSSELIVISDIQGKILQASPSTFEALGYAPGEMIGHVSADFILPEDKKAADEGTRAARNGRITTTFSTRMRHKNGGIVPLLWSAVWSEQDRWYICMGRDMSDYERSQAELRQAQKMEAVGQLTGGVAHDFNNILMVILARAEAMEEDEALPPALRDDVEAIRGATERAASLTRQLLAFSRKQPLRPQVVDLNKLVTATSQLLERTLGENIRLANRLGQDVAAVDIDRGQLEAALVNLCINARDAMPKGGNLTIETTNLVLDEEDVSEHADMEAGEYVMLAISDTGTGMSRETLEKVFEPFFTTKAVGKGTGLGLSMVYGFVKQSHGHIRLYSELGRGTTVKIFLPQVRVTDEAVPGPKAVINPRGSERVLVVEDDFNVRRGVVAQVKSLGYDVAEAASAAEGLEVLTKARFPFHVLLTDVVMPGAMNGPALAVEARRLYPGLNVVFMSGYTDAAIGQQGRLEAGVLLLSKPFRKEELAQMLRQALGT